MSNSVTDNPSGTQDFLARSERLLAEGSLQEAADFAQRRLSSVPDDLEAQVILARALMGMGERDRASELIRRVRVRISEWQSVLNSLDSSGTAAHDDAERSPEIPDPPDPEKGVRKSEMSSGRKNPDQDQDAPALFKEFYTLTMAELFLKQGHLKSAREVLKTILKNNPSDPEALRKLNELDQIPSGKETGLNSSKRRLVMNEMERWIRNLRNSRNAEPRRL